MDLVVFMIFLRFPAIGFSSELHSDPPVLRIVDPFAGKIKRGTPARKVAPAALGDFVNLAGELEAVWNHPDSDARLKKRIVRALVEEVVVNVDSEGGEIIAVIHWRGGVHTELRMPRRRRGHSRAHTPKEVVEAVRILTRICSDDMIAGTLTRNGLLTGMGNRWTRERLLDLSATSRNQLPMPMRASDTRV
jgi:hypothetical protein